MDEEDATLKTKTPADIYSKKFSCNKKIKLSHQWKFLIVVTVMISFLMSLILAAIPSVLTKSSPTGRTNRFHENDSMNVLILYLIVVAVLGIILVILFVLFQDKIREMCNADNMFIGAFML